MVARFPHASKSRPAATAAYSETPCVCARPSDPRKQCLSAAPRARPSSWHCFCSQNLRQIWLSSYYFVFNPKNSKIKIYVEVHDVLVLVFNFEMCCLNSADLLVQWFFRVNHVAVLQQFFLRIRLVRILESNWIWSYQTWTSRASRGGWPVVRSGLWTILAQEDKTWGVGLPMAEDFILNCSFQSVF